jgi:hypothetical protein
MVHTDISEGHTESNFSPEDGGRCIPPKRWYLSTGPHSVQQEYIYNLICHYFCIPLKYIIYIYLKALVPKYHIMKWYKGRGGNTQKQLNSRVHFRTL